MIRGDTMNLWSLLYFTSFIFYIFSGAYVLSLSKKSIINIMFSLMCLTLGLWSLGYAFTTAANTLEEAQRWRIVSTIGWSYFYTTMLIFLMSIVNSKWVKKNIKYSFFLYIPSTFFFVMFSFYDKGHLISQPYGWVHVIYNRSIWSHIFDIYYLSCVIVGFFLLLNWKRKSESLREQRQIHIILVTMLIALVGGASTDTLLPILNIKILPLGVVFCTIVVSGIWVAITKYKMMTLTQEIAAEHVLRTMMDPVIVLNTDYIIGQVNNAATDLTGYTPNEIIGEEASLIINEFTQDSKLVKELSNHGYINGYEIELMSKGNSKTPCLCSGVCVKTDYGEKIGAIFVLHDITRRKFNEELIKQTNERLKLKIAKLNNVFDNVGQGILTFKNDLKVQEEYSHECKKIFRKQIEKELFPNLLYPDDSQMQLFLKDLLKSIFESDFSLREIYLSLLPDELVTHNKSIKVEYKFTEDQDTEPITMAIITDITEKKQFQNEVDIERKTLRMVIKAIISRDELVELIRDYRTFINKKINSKDVDVDSLLRKIHTYKGNFSQYNMVNLVDKLNQLEESLSLPNVDIELIHQSDMLSWLNHDLDIIENYVGKGFFNGGDVYNLSSDQLSQFEEKVHLLLKPNEANKISSLIKDLKKKPLHDLLNNYVDYTMKLADRLGKKIKPFSITGDLVFVDRRDYQELIKSMVHIFRDCVDHGIEIEDERIEIGKENYGNIYCEVRDSKDEIIIIIGDDGRGINISELKDKVVEQGLLNKVEFESLSHDEKLKMIFKHRVSTKDHANIFSGRGVGLAAVEAAVIKHGGSIKVQSEDNKGTNFTIRLPKKTDNENNLFSSDDFLKDIVMTTRDIVSNKTGYDFLEKQMQYNNIIELDEITVLISIKGSINCMIGFSVDTYKAKHLVRSMLLGNIDDEELSEYMDDACGELVNTILGNTLEKYQESKGIIEIGIPIVLRNRGGYLRYNRSENICYRLTYENHNVNIFMLLEDEYLLTSI